MTFEDHPVRSGLGVFTAAVAIFVIAAVIAGIGHFALGWFNKAAEVAGPENVSSQYREVINDWETLEAAAQNACSAQDSSRSQADPTLLEDPAFAYEATYRRVRVDYNRRQANLFEAKVVGPGGYPAVAPTLEEMQVQVC